MQTAVELVPVEDAGTQVFFMRRKKEHVFLQKGAKKNNRNLKKKYGATGVSRFQGVQSVSELQ